MRKQRTGADSDAATVHALVNEISVQLENAGIEQAHIEARDIVAVVADANRFWPVLHGNDDAPKEMTDLARRAAARRALGAPFAYAVGQAAFRHLTLRVDERVLIPRQETEVLVDLVLNRLRGSSGGTIVDIGTGSGAIALALATELRLTAEAAQATRIISTDISAAAIDLARANAERVLDGNSLTVEFRCGDMFSVVRETGLSAVVSNPPYIAFEEARSLPSSVRNWEPPEALYSDRQGMRALERLVRGSATALGGGGLLALEVDSNRASLAAELVLSNGAFHGVSVERDLTGRDRFVLATKS